jgi:hypothetical protein
MSYINDDKKFNYFFFFHLFICAYNVWVISPEIQLFQGKEVHKNEEYTVSTRAILFKYYVSSERYGIIL